MKGLVFNGPRDIRYENFEDPKLETPNGVIVNVSKCSICGSDLHIYHGDNISNQKYDADAPKFCVGHEFIGEIVESGPDVHTFKTGDKVLSAGGAGCGKCDKCLSGKPLECRYLTAFGTSEFLHGGQAEYVFVPNADQTLLKTNDVITDEHALLLTDAMATAYFGLTRADVKPGDRVAIVGLGPIGIIGVELAFLMGAAEVFAIDPVAHRREAAEALGAKAFEPGREGIHAIRDATEGKGPECVFEASGASKAIESVLRIVRPEGTVSFIGLPQPGDALNMQLLLFKNVTARGGVARVQDTWPALTPLLASGRLKAAGLFSHNFKLSEGAEAYRTFDARDDGVVKIMINVD